MKKYSNVFELIKSNSEANKFYNSLPDYVKEQIQTRADSVNSFESLQHYAENITQGDH